MPELGPCLGVLKPLSRGHRTAILTRCYTITNALYQQGRIVALLKVKKNANRILDKLNYGHSQQD